MSRGLLITLGVVDCGFGLLALFGPEEGRAASYLVNGVLAIGLAIASGTDLRRRGHAWAWAFALLYPLAPLLGLIAYVILSSGPATNRFASQPAVPPPGATP